MQLNSKAILDIKTAVDACKGDITPLDFDIDCGSDVLLRLAGCQVAPMLYFSTPNQRVQYVGLGCWASFSNDDAASFLDHHNHEGIMLMGCAAFDGRNATDIAPSEWWVLPVCMIILTPNQSKLRVVCHPNKDGQWSTIESILIQLMDAKVQPRWSESYGDMLHHPSKAQWCRVVNTIKAALTTSELEKVVLARESHATFNKIVNPFSMMAVIQPHDPGLFHFVVKFSEDEAFIGGTPERLFDMTMTEIASDAIAGTIRNDAGGAELLQRQKDASEHQYVSDFILTAMSGLCDGPVEFNKERALLELSVVSHLMQTFKGKRRPTVGPLDAMAALHPTPAVAGTPQGLAMDTIKQMEPFSRQWYAGPMGVLSTTKSTVVVAIRSGVVSGDTVTLYAGAGIVDASNPESEWDELNAKISGFEALFRS